MPATRLSRRSALHRSCVVATSATGVASLSHAADVLVGHGGERLRVGVIGCGGRGTGAAAQAAAADPGIRIVALADLFAEQIDTSLAELHAAVGAAVDVPQGRRFTGRDGWRRLLDTDLDVVILATAPDARPEQAAAAVAAGRHVYCEAPAAVDAAGLAWMLATCRRARAAGLSMGSGLAWRHDPATARAIEAIAAGAVGTPRAAAAWSRIGPAWHKPAVAGHSPSEGRHRNWIGVDALSGGDFVEHQVHAIDKVLWAFGDEPPVAVEPLATAPAATAVRYLFADGRTLEAGISRRAGGRQRIDEWVRGTRGGVDLRAAGTGAGRHQRSMAAFVRSIRGGTPLAEGLTLCRSTATALLGRAASARRSPLAWEAFAPA